MGRSGPAIVEPVPDARSEWSGGESVPLSEEEQRILQEMEQKLYADDRALADRIAHRQGGHHAGRSCRWAALFFLGGFALLLLTFRDSVVLGTAGFIVMLFSALFFERNLRQLDGPLLGAFSRGLRGRGIGGEISDLRQRIRQHFKHQT
jgi:hypothetical protein